MPSKLCQSWSVPFGSPAGSGGGDLISETSWGNWGGARPGLEFLFQGEGEGGRRGRNAVLHEPVLGKPESEKKTHPCRASLKASRGKEE